MIFGRNQAGLFLFHSPGGADVSAKSTFHRAAEELGGKMLFVMSDLRTGLARRMAEYVGVNR